MASETLEEASPAGEDESPAAEPADPEVEKDREEAEAEAREEVKEKKKRGRKKGGVKKEEEEVGAPEKKVRKRRSSEEQATPVERPSRERKTVERYMAMSPRKPVTPKGVPIKQGSGTKLRDIPNVVFKLSKRKADENLQHLHKILFGKKAKVNYVKRNISEFSGFVWTDSEEKEKAKLREKLDKCVKDRLLDFCDVLDIPVSKASTKKEDVLALMLDFLQSPRVTRDVVLKEKEQSGKKRKRKAKGASQSTSGEKRRRHKKNSAKTEDEENQEEDVDKDEEDGSADDKGAASDEDVSDHSDQEKNEADEDTEIEPEPVKNSPAKKQIKKGSRSIVREEKKPMKKGKSESKEDTPKKGGSSMPGLEKSSSVKRVSTKSNNVESVSPSGTKSKNAESKSQKNQDSSTREKKANTKQAPEVKPKSRASGKGKAAKKDAESPTREEMHAVVSDILKEVDFNTATLADILKQLGTHFGTDLMHRKAEVKSIIEEVISSMTDEESDEEGGGAEEASEEAGNAEETPGENSDSKGKPGKRVDNKESPEAEGQDE